MGKRLGKREREAKRALVKANLAAPLELTPRALMPRNLAAMTHSGHVRFGFARPERARDKTYGRWANT